ncbi:Pycsar system effector family protein [Streptomyces lividans]|uniref:SpdB3-like n=1 Tax=Streptomyces lividans 1326 TaxID=1200984 RepID=Q848D6_STRLI|nr:MULTISPECIES: Pycsar system effector family protein [Streptomyces]AAO61178.1 spdB3-like [Streptomyces lividans 1326]
MTTAPISHTDRNLDAACTAVASEISRTDSKASLLLAFNGAALAGLASIADHDLPTPVKVAGTLAVLALGTAAVLLLLVVRPNLSGDDRASFPYWARLRDDDDVRACMNSDTRAARIRVLSTIALAKFSRLRQAVNCTLAALGLLALAAVLALL